MLTHIHQNYNEQEIISVDSPKSQVDDFILVFFPCLVMDNPSKKHIHKQQNTLSFLQFGEDCSILQSCERSIWKLWKNF